MHHCSALPATFNSYCHQMRKPRNHAPLLRAACDRAACDLQFLLPSNENTSKTMHHCSALPVTFNSYYSQMRKPRDHAPLLRAACDLQFLLPSNEKTSKPCTTAPRCLRPSIAQTSKPMRKPRKPNVKNLGAACDLQFLLPSNENTSKTMHHCSALPATFNSYCHQMRKPRDHAPRLRAACDLQLLQPFNVKTLENEPLLRAACDLQLLLPSNDKTSKTMHHCSALPATFNSYCHQMRKPRRPCTTAPRCLRPSIAQTSKPMRKPRKPNVKNLGAACDLQFLLPSNENTSKTMHHCSALPATFNSYCHQMRKPRDHAPLLRAACDLQLLQPFNVKTLENEPLLRAACDLQLLLPSNDKTSKTMHHCSALPATFNC
jgi:hypothetical protein